MEKDNKSIEDYVYNYPTKYKEGFIQPEIDKLLSEFTGLHMDKWDAAMMGNTCMTSEDGFIIYHCDIVTALKCALENRDQTFFEWD